MMMATKREAEAYKLHWLLENWGRWLRQRPRQGHCVSIEHRFSFKKRPDDTWTGWGDWNWTDKDRIVYQPPVDALQALDVERVMRWIPEGHRKALFLFYVVRFPYRICCKRLHIGYDIWSIFLGDAQRMVVNHLKTTAKPLTHTHVERICLPTIRPPAPAEILAPCGAGCIG